MFCPNCMTSNDDNATVCVKCGRNFKTGEVPQGNQEPITAGFAVPVGRTGLAIVAGYLGLLSIIPIFAPISLVVSIVALVKLKKTPGKLGRGRAIFGLIMGILGTSLLVYVSIAIIRG